MPFAMRKAKRLIKWTIILTLLVIVAPHLMSRFSAQSNRLSLNVTGSQTVPSKQKLKVVCYNIAHGRGLAESNWTGGDHQTRLNRLDEIGDLLNKIDADVVILNEVDFDASWSNNVNQAKYLAEKCGYSNWVEERNLDFRVVHRTWRFGNAILSKLPLSNASLIDLPHYSVWETAVAGKKCAFGVDVQLSENQFVHVVAAHLSHRSEDLRERSAKVIIEHVRNQELPCIIGGDMNSSPKDFPRSNSAADGRNAMETFAETEQFKRSQVASPGDSSECTFRSDQPEIVIDWFLISQDLEFLSFQVIDSPLSDHRPISADIKLKTGNAAVVH